MSYSPDNPDDVVMHQEHHDKVINGVHSLPSEGNDVIWSEGEMQITIVNNLSPLERHLEAEEMVSIARLDTPQYSGIILGDMSTCFLLRKRDRIIGLLIAEERDHILQTSWVDLQNNKKPKKLLIHPPMWSICFIWILKCHRGCHLGRMIVSKVIVFWKCNYDSIGWQMPFTDSGEALVRRCCPTRFYIA